MKRATIWVAVAGLAVILTGCGDSYKVADIPPTVATVDGQSISADDYLNQTSRRAGREVLTNQIEQAIIIEWAKDEKVPPTEEQIQKQVEIYERDGMYDRQVKLMGEEAVKAELTAMQARINLAKKIIDIDEDQLNSTYEMMKSRYVHGPRKYVALIVNPDKKKVEEAAKAVKDGTSFDDAAVKYSDRRFQMGGGPIELWIDEDQQGLPKEFVDAAKKTELDQVSKVFSFGQTGMPTNYVVMKVTREQPKSDLKLKDVKDEVKDAAALQMSQTDPEFNEELDERKKDAEIKVNVPYLKGVAETINNPEPNPMMGQMKPGPAPKPAPKEESSEKPAKSAPKK